MKILTMKNDLLLKEHGYGYIGQVVNLSMADVCI